MYKNGLKRGLDFILSLCGIIVLSPVLLVLAVLVTGGPAASRARAGARSRQSPRRPVAADPDALALASSLEVFALCLNAGMPVSAAAAATARCAPPGLARTLRRGAAHRPGRGRSRLFPHGRKRSGSG